MSADSSANMARSQSTYRSGRQGAAVQQPSTAVTGSLSTTAAKPASGTSTRGSKSSK